MINRTPQSRKPNKILVDIDSKQIQINWADGHSSVYGMTYLRRACPCIECQPWKEGMGEVGKPSEQALTAEGDLSSPGDISTVGAYGIQFNWKDGHNTGIYDFGYLRDLCPCPECIAAFSGDYRPDLA